MSIGPILAGIPYYRITALSFVTSSPALHNIVVNGQGARKSRDGGRYNHPGVVTVYLAEEVNTVLAEKMFYFQREVLRALNLSHLTKIMPSYKQTFALWEIEFLRDIPNVLTLDFKSASGYYVFPSMMLNPSRDYEHLKDRRAEIETQPHNGLIAPSSRCTSSSFENMLVLFADQSSNVAKVQPYAAELKLLKTDPPLTDFANPMSDALDFSAGSVKIAPIPPHSTSLPAKLLPYATNKKVEFRH